jgi:hypothetical protein
MKLCLCKVYYTLLSVMNCKFCSIVSPWKMTLLAKKNGINNHWNWFFHKWSQNNIQENLNHENYYHENLKIYIIHHEMRCHEIILVCKWYYSFFWLVGYIFCDNMSPWNNMLATMKNGTYNHEKWYLWFRKLIPITIQNSKFAHVFLKKDTMKLVTMKTTTMKF